MTYKSKMVFFTTLHCFLELDLADILHFLGADSRSFPLTCPNKDRGRPHRPRKLRGGAFLNGVSIS